MKIDGDFEVFPVAKASGPLPSAADILPSGPNRPPSPYASSDDTDQKQPSLRSAAQAPGSMPNTGPRYPSRSPRSSPSAGASTEKNSCPGSPSVVQMTIKFLVFHDSVPFGVILSHSLTHQNVGRAKYICFGLKKMSIVFFLAANPCTTQAKALGKKRLFASGFQVHTASQRMIRSSSERINGGS